MTETERAFPEMSARPLPVFAPREAELILPHMRGACVTKGTTVHMLFRVTASRSAQNGPSAA